jgi:DNA-binding GntR family transcriptional regulator
MMPSEDRRLDRVSSSEQVAAHIRRSILSGELVKGDRIHQGAVADELGVSRIPVREAIIALDREGWLHFEANRGAFVAGLTADDIQDHYELRGLVFGLVARRATENATDEEIASFAALEQAMRDAEDLEAFAAINNRFIATMLRVARSPRLAAALRVTPAIMIDGFFEFVTDGRRVQEAGVRSFVRALRAHSADDADRALREMLSHHGQAMLQAFVRRGLVSAS